jgi:hypothetical protein
LIAFGRTEQPTKRFLEVTENTDKMKTTKYAALDCKGLALQFTASGRSVQCADEAADLFDTQAKAEAALKLAEECGGQVVPQHDPTDR